MDPRAFVLARALMMVNNKAEKVAYVIENILNSFNPETGRLECKMLVFVNSKRLAGELQWEFDAAAQQQDYAKRFVTESLHGDRDQLDRDAALRALKEDTCQVLIATDVAARGLDIKGVTKVINFDPANDIETHTHRIGRTGRAGNRGEAVTLINAGRGEEWAIKPIVATMKKTGQEIPLDLAEAARACGGRSAGRW